MKKVIRCFSLSCNPQPCDRSCQEGAWNSLSGVEVEDPRCLTFADCRLQTADCRPQTADCRPQTADCRLQTADCRLQTAVCKCQTTGDPRPGSALYNFFFYRYRTFLVTLIQCVDIEMAMFVSLERRLIHSVFYWTFLPYSGY